VEIASLSLRSGQALCKDRSLAMTELAGDCVPLAALGAGLLAALGAGARTLRSLAMTDNLLGIASRSLSSGQAHAKDMYQ